MGFKPGLTADNEPETLKAQAFSVGQSEYSGQVNDAVRSSATATEFLATDGNPVLQGGEDVMCMSWPIPAFRAGERWVIPTVRRTVVRKNCLEPRSPPRLTWSLQGFSGTPWPPNNRSTGCSRKPQGARAGARSFSTCPWKQPYFKIVPPVGGIEIKCIFPLELLTQAAASVEHNATVEGELKSYEDDLWPHEVRVRHIEIHPLDSELPTLSELAGSAPDSTGELSAAEFVRELRNEW